MEMMWGLTWYLPWGIYTWIPTWTQSQNSQATAEALSLKISSHGTSLKLSQRSTQSAQEVTGYALKWDILLWIWWNEMKTGQWKLRQQHDQNFPMEGKPPEEKNKSKRAGLWELKSGMQVGKLTIWVGSFEIITEFTRFISSTTIG